MDHFNEGNTYQNKYYVNDTYWYHPSHSRVLSLCLHCLSASLHLVLLSRISTTGSLALTDVAWAG